MIKKAGISTEHPEYMHFAKRWAKMNDALSDEDAVKDAGEKYLPKTGGMRKNDHDEVDYNAYKLRARFPEVTTQALTGMVGLIFEQDPVGTSDEVVTNTNQTNVELARDLVRAVASKGRDILVTDAGANGVPFVARYVAESLINWKVEADNPGNLTMAVFREERDIDPEGYGHETETIYRRYQKVSSQVIVTEWKVEDDVDVQIGEEIILPVSFVPIIAVGSIDSVPSCDPIPLMPVARCAFAFYRKSANYEHGLYLTSQPTAYVSGVNQDQYDNIIEQGIGSSSLWYLGQEGKAGFLEATAAGLSENFAAMQNELKQAETYAVRLTQDSGGVESAQAIKMRAATQHASIYSISDSVSIAVDRALEMRALWAGRAKPEAFYLRTEFESEYAGEQMINALNTAVNSGNAPLSAMFEAIRRSGLSEKTDEEMLDEIETQRVEVDEPVLPVKPVVEPVEDDPDDA